MRDLDIDGSKKMVYVTGVPWALEHILRGGYLDNFII